MSNNTYPNPFEAYGNSFSNPYGQFQPSPFGAPQQSAFAGHAPQNPFDYRAQQQQHHHQTQMEAQRRAQMEAQRRAQIQAHRQAQMQAHHQTQMGDQHMQAMDPRYQHTYAHQYNTNVPTEIQMRQQEQIAARARDAQRKQYDMVKREQDKKISHLLYYDPNQPACENSWKMSIGMLSIHPVNVTDTPEDAIPNCVISLPAIVILKENRCLRGSKCEQYLKRLTQPRDQQPQRYIDPFQPVGNRLRLRLDQATEKQEPILDKEMNDLSAVYERWPKFDKDPLKAKQQSDAMLRRIASKIQSGEIKVEDPIDDKGGSRELQHTQAQVAREVQERERQSKNDVRRQQKVPAFKQQLP